MLGKGYAYWYNGLYFNLHMEGLLPFTADAILICGHNRADLVFDDAILARSQLAVSDDKLHRVGQLTGKRTALVGDDTVVDSEAGILVDTRSCIRQVDAFPIKMHTYAKLEDRNRPEDGDILREHRTNDQVTVAIIIYVRLCPDAIPKTSKGRR